MPDVELRTNLTLGGDVEYKKALKGINDQLKVAKSGMAAATSAFAKNDKSIAANKVRQEELGKVLDVQRKKAALIQEEIEKLSKADGDNEDEINKLKVTYNNLIAQINRTQREMEGLGSATEEETEETKEADKENKKFGDTLKKIGGKTLTKGIKALTAGIAAVGAAAAAAGKQMVQFIGGAGEYADDINTLSTQTGVATETLQKWRYAEKLIDVDTATMTGAMKKLTKQMGAADGGSKAAAATFKKFGISITDANGNLRSSEDVFYDAIDALGKIENETERDAMAMELFGKSASDLNPLIEGGTQQLRNLGEEAERSGYVLGDKLMWGAHRYQDAHDRMTNASEALRNTIGALLGPTMAGFADKVTGMMTKVTKALSDGLQPGELETLIADLQKDFKGLFDDILKTAQDAMPLFTEALTTLVTSIVDALPGLVETLLPAAEKLLQSVLDSLIANAGPIAALASDVIVSLTGFITENLPKVAEAAVTIMSNLIDGLTDALPDLIPMAVQMIVKLATELVNALPKLIEKLPEITAAIIQGLKNIDWIQLGNDLIDGFAKGLEKAAVAGWKAIQTVFDQIWTAIKGVFGIRSDGEQASSSLAADAAKNILGGLVSGFTNAVDAVLESVKAIFGRIWDAIKSIFGFGKTKEQKEQEGEAKKAGGDIMSGMSDGIKGNEKKVKDSAKDAGKNTITAFNDALGNKGGKSTKGQDIGKNLALGFADGISANQSKITKAAKDAAKAAYDAAKKELDIHSPSRVMMKIGAFYDLGFAEGINKNASKVMDAADALAAMTTRPNSGYNATAAGAAMAANSGAAGGSVINVNTEYHGPFTMNDGSVFGQMVARQLRESMAVMG